MATFKVRSQQLMETKERRPAGLVVEGMTFKQIDSIGNEKFKTKEEADDVFRKHFLAKGYTEIVE